MLLFSLYLFLKKSQHGHDAPSYGSFYPPWFSNKEQIGGNKDGRPHDLSTMSRPDIFLLSATTSSAVFSPTSTNRSSSEDPYIPAPSDRSPRMNLPKDAEPTAGRRQRSYQSKKLAVWRRKKKRKKRLSKELMAAVPCK